MKSYSRNIDRRFLGFVILGLMKDHIPFACDYKEELVEISVPIEYRKKLNIISSESQKSKLREKVV